MIGIGLSLTVAGFATALRPTAALAQMAMPGSGRSLGGYGASAISSYYSTGSTAYVPYSGNAHGFVPYGGGTWTSYGEQPVSRQLPQSAIGGNVMPNTPIGGASLSGGMGMGGGRRSGVSMSARSRRATMLPFGYEAGAGMGGMGGMSTRMDARRASAGPGFGYPFRMPMSSGTSSSMAMP
jgi:hypothetical protein